MARILLLILNFFASSFLKQVLVGAGLSLVSGAFVLTMVNQYISSAQSNMSGFGQYAGLMGLAGLDTALSILVGALVFRATVASLKIALAKAA